MWTKFKTALAVVLLSGLIWVFAERSVTKSATVTVNIGLSQSRENLLVQWIDEQGQAHEFMQVKLDVEGPSGRIQDIAENELIPQISPLTIEQIGYQQTGDPEFTREVISLLNGELTFEGDIYLPIINAYPSQLRLRVTKLERALLNIKVYDYDSRQPLEVEILKPENVDAFVEAGTTPEAEIFFTADQQLQASSGPIMASAEVRLPGRAPQKFSVEVKLRAGIGSLWPEGEISRSSIRVGIFWPRGLQGYEVEFEDLEARLDDYSPIRFQFQSQAALNAYQDQEHLHLMLEVKESDLKGQYTGRRLRYHLPEGREDEINIIDPESKSVRFRVKKITGPSQTSSSNGKVIKKAG